MLELFKDDYKPNKRYALLMKVSSYENIKKMQSGLLYMNSLDYFSNLRGETGIQVRSDELESTFAKFIAGNKNANRRIELELSHPSVGKLRVPKGTEVTIGVPNSKNVFIFCMTCIEQNEDGTLKNMVNGDKFYFDRRMKKFGSHVLVIRDAHEFFKRYSKAINKTNEFYIDNLMDEGCGTVTYKNLRNHQGKIGLFLKDKKYSWQREYRFVLGANESALNKRGALELDIGNISDISTIVETRRLITVPITAKHEKMKLLNHYHIY